MYSLVIEHGVFDRADQRDAGHRFSGRVYLYRQPSQEQSTGRAGRFYYVRPLGRGRVQDVVNAQLQSLSVFGHHDGVILSVAKFETFTGEPYLSVPCVYSNVHLTAS